jgi:hypothetical protein
MHHDSLWLFLPNSLTRRFLFIVTMHPYYRVACAICTVIACAVYAAEPAGDDPRNSRAASMSYVDMLLNLWFGYELAIKARFACFRASVCLRLTAMFCAAGGPRLYSAPRQRSAHAVRLV